MALTIKITDDTTTADLTDETNYMVVDSGWVPQVAARTNNDLGGIIYEDVEEEIEIIVMGSTGAAALANLAVLSRLFDQAERWANGDAVAAVIFQYKPSGSTKTNPYEAIIVGRGEGAGFIGLSTSFDANGNVTITGVRLRFRRRGAWLNETDTTSVSAATISTVLSATWGATHNTLSPMTLLLSGSAFTLNSAGYVLYSRNAANLAIAEGESVVSIGSGGSSASQADSGNYARGGSVRRVTLSTPAAYQTLSVDPTFLSSLATAATRTIILVVAVRNNSATETFKIRAQPYKGVWPLAKTRPITVDNTNNNPQILIFEPINTPSGITAIDLELQVSSLTGTPTFDIDYICVMGVTDGDSGIIAYQPKTSSGGSSISSVHALNSQIIEYPYAMVVADTSVAVTIPIDATGNADVYTYGSTLSAVLLATSGTAWRNNNAGSAITTSLGLSRRRAYITPE